jgi:hypothetical protein
MRYTIYLLACIACISSLQAAKNTGIHSSPLNQAANRENTPADTIGSFTFWSGSRNASYTSIPAAAYSASRLKQVTASGKAVKFSVGFSKKGYPVEAWYFPGSSEKKAMVIGGVHGSELSSIETAYAVISNLLAAEKPAYSVLVIPCLFPDNARQALQNPATIGSTQNTGRYSKSSAPDPNRQLPAPGRAYDPQSNKDALGRTIEKENAILLQLVNDFKPERIASIHAIRDTSHAGIYADPRTDEQGIALGFEPDSTLAVTMAALAQACGARVPGNNLENQPAALYYRDPVPAKKGTRQSRNFKGSSLPSGRGQGVSLGTWAATAIKDPQRPEANRQAMVLVTVELPGYKRATDYSSGTHKQFFSRQVQAYAHAITGVFLQDSIATAVSAQDVSARQ